MQKAKWKRIWIVQIVFQKWYIISEIHFRMIEGIECKKRKYINRVFCELLLNQFRESGIVEIEPIIRFLIRHNIIRQTIVNRFVVIRVYPEYLERFGKQKAVGQMSKVLPITESAIYSILANHYSYFRPNKIDFWFFQLCPNRTSCCYKNAIQDVPEWHTIKKE